MAINNLFIKIKQNLVKYIDITLEKVIKIQVYKL